MPRIVHFEIQATDLEKTRAFYAEVFGWQANQWESPDKVPYVLLTTGPEEEPGINGGMMVRNGPPPAEGAGVNAFVCVVDVPDIDDYVARVENAGGAIVVPKFEVSGVGFVAYGKDPDGNIFGMNQAVRAASGPHVEAGGS